MLLILIIFIIIIIILLIVNNKKPIIKHNYIEEDNVITSNMLLHDITSSVDENVYKALPKDKMIMGSSNNLINNLILNTSI